MAGPRQEGLRRDHVRAIPLLRTYLDHVRGPLLPSSVDFVVGNPDGRVRTALAVFFVPDPPAPLDASDSVYQGYFDAGMHGFAVMGRESPNEQGGGLRICDRVFGTLSAPISLPGDTFGWLVSDEADAREWYCRLRADLIQDVWAVPGRWVARCTFTSMVEMTVEEWRRTADRIYLRTIEEGERAVAVGDMGG